METLEKLKALTELLAVELNAVPRNNDMIALINDKIKEILKNI